jgi:hypothetical protein
MPDNLSEIHQSIFLSSSPSIIVQFCQEQSLTKAILKSLLDTTQDNCIGVAPAYGSGCTLRLIAFSTMSRVLVVQFSKQEAKKDRRPNLPAWRKLLKDNILCHPQRLKCAFKMDKLSTALHMDLGLSIMGGVDLLSTSTADRHSTETLMTVLGGETTLRKQNVIALFKHDESINAPDRDIAQQAWAAYRAASSPILWSAIARLPKINTAVLSKTVCPLFSTLCNGSHSFL